MNALVVQNTHPKRDQETRTITDYRQYLTIIIIIIIILLRLYYICVCVTTYTPVLYNSQYKKAIQHSVKMKQKQLCGFNHVHEMKQVQRTAFKQDELCFHLLFCYQKCSKSVEVTIVSCKNCHNLIVNFKSVGSSIEVPMSLVVQKFRKQIDTQTENLITETLCFVYVGEG